MCDRSPPHIPGHCPPPNPFEEVAEKLREMEAAPARIAALEQALQAVTRERDQAQEMSLNRLRKLTSITAENTAVIQKVAAERDSWKLRATLEMQENGRYLAERDAALATAKKLGEELEQARRERDDARIQLTAMERDRDLWQGQFNSVMDGCAEAATMLKGTPGEAERFLKDGIRAALTAAESARDAMEAQAAAMRELLLQMQREAVDACHHEECPARHHANGDCGCPDEIAIRAEKPCVDGACECLLHTDDIFHALAPDAGTRLLESHRRELADRDARIAELQDQNKNLCDYEEAYRVAERALAAARAAETGDEVKR
jgi:hypothetical protein